MKTYESLNFMFKVEETQLFIPNTHYHSEPWDDCERWSCYSGCGHAGA